MFFSKTTPHLCLRFVFFLILRLPHLSKKKSASSSFGFSGSLSISHPIPLPFFKTDDWMMALTFRTSYSSNHSYGFQILISRVFFLFSLFCVISASDSDLHAAWEFCFSNIEDSFLDQYLYLFLLCCVFSLSIYEFDIYILLWEFSHYLRLQVFYIQWILGVWQ